ncbi:MAG: B12-binding domain-containing radical SAM protein [Oscillospiraceae bacterium]|nr:B12-binding domain-containing radical SAM protein [Oscillospiraceae bacterium]
MITFIDLSIMFPGVHSNYIPYTLGILRCAQTVKEAGYHVGLIQRPLYKDEKNWINELSIQIANSNSEIICFASRCDYYPHLLNLIKSIKKIRGNIIIIVGGIQASLTDISTMEYCPEIDFIIRGEGESALPRLIRLLIDDIKYIDIPGVTYRNNEKIVRDPDIEEINNIDYLLDLDIIDYADDLNCDCLYVEAGRGCTYNCQFCCTKTLWKRKYRLCPPDKVYQNMRLLYKRFGIKHFKFIHDNFLSGGDFYLFLNDFKNTDGFTWGGSARIDALTNENIKLLAEKGCKQIYCGIESGSLRMQKIYRKNLDLSVIPAIMNALEKNGVSCTFSFIIGHPEESYEDLNDTLTLAVECKKHYACDEIQIHKLVPHAGSKLFDLYSKSLVFDNNISDMSDISPESFNLADFDAGKELFSSFYSFNNLNPDNYRIVNRANDISNFINAYSNVIACISKVCGMEIIDVMNIFLETKNETALLAALIKLSLEYNGLDYREMKEQLSGADFFYGNT